MMMQSGSIDIYNLALKSGSNLKGTDKTTIPRLLEVFESEVDVNNAVKLLIFYIYRQKERKELRGEGVNDLLRSIKAIYERFRNDPDNLRDTVRKYLILVKWVYEFRLKKDNPVRSFEELLREVQ
jgi:hypothetical protein